MLSLLALPLGVPPYAIPPGYNPEIPPSLAGCSHPTPTLVKAQLHVTKLHGINERVQTLRMNVNLRLVWTDYRLAFNVNETTESERCAVGAAGLRSFSSKGASAGM